MWRGYAADAGVSIGFRVEKLADRVDRVVYDEQEYRMKVQATLEGFRLSGNTGERICGDLIMLAARYKDSVWAEEHEYRLAEWRKQGDPEVNFRPGRFGLIPYVGVEIDRAAIESICIGPGNFQREFSESLSWFLRKLGMTSVKVTKSKVALRP